MINKQNEGWIDITNNELMIKLGMRYPDYVTPDFSKTIKEKKALKKIKRSCADKIITSWPKTYTPSFPLFCKLIIRLKHNSTYPNTTYSHKVWQYQVPNIVNSYKSKKGRCIVDYYIWNGKKYDPTEIPINPYEV